jgi:hypothetical protein
MTIVVFNSVFGEKIAVGNGFGYDGQRYGAWALDFRGRVLKEGLDAYYIQRFLPSAIVHMGLSVSGASRTVPNVIKGFIVLNVLCQLTCVVLWHFTCNELELSGPSRSFSLLALFCNFFFLKMIPFEPVQTDPMAYMCALLQILFFLRGATAGLLMTTLVAAFIWPTAWLVGLLLAVYPRNDPGEPLETRTSRRHAALVVAAVVLIFLLAFARLWRRGHLTIYNEPPPLREVLPLSLVLAVAYIVGGLFYLLDYAILYQPARLLRSAHWRNAVLALVVVAAVKLTQRSLIDVTMYTPFTLLHRVKFSVVTSVAKPAISLLALMGA